MRTARQISAQVRKNRIKKPLAKPPVQSQISTDDDLDDDSAWNTDRVLKQFFIDRDGVIRRYTGDLKKNIISMHYQIASDLFPDIKYPQSPDDHVYKVLGWILCGSTVYNTPICYRKPTAKQLQALRDLGDVYFKYLCFPYKDQMMKYDQYSALCDD